MDINDVRGNASGYSSGTRIIAPTTIALNVAVTHTKRLEFDFSAPDDSTIDISNISSPICERECWDCRHRRQSFCYSYCPFGTDKYPVTWFFATLFTTISNSAGFLPL